MEVIAIKPAFFNGHRVRVGAELDIPENTKGSWFAPKDSTKAKAAKDSTKAKANEPRTLSQAAGDSAKSFTQVLADKA